MKEGERESPPCTFRRNGEKKRREGVEGPTTTEEGGGEREKEGKYIKGKIPKRIPSE